MTSAPTQGSEPIIKGPLNGIRVLDLTRLYPGPLGTMFLAQMGAEVIKIEAPTRVDGVRGYPPFVDGVSAAYLALNRGKKSLALDVRKPEGKALFMALVKTADVVAEGFRPGVMEESGLGYADLRAQNERLVYLSLSGFGRSGPYAQKAGHDLNYLGYSGVLGAMGTEASGPAIPSTQMADVAGGYLCVSSCLAALWERERTGIGRHLDLSLMDGVMPFATLQLAYQWASPEPLTRGTHPLSGGLACYGVYRCADGGHLALAALEPKFWATFCNAVGKEDWISRQFGPGDQRALKQALEELFLERTRDQWTLFAEEHECCLSPVLELGEVGENEHLRERGLVRGDSRETSNLGSPFRFDEEPLPSAPTLGAHNQELLQELGIGTVRVAELMQSGVIN